MGLICYIVIDNLYIYPLYRISLYFTVASPCFNILLSFLLMQVLEFNSTLQFPSAILYMTCHIWKLPIRNKHDLILSLLFLIYLFLISNSLSAVTNIFSYLQDLYFCGLLVQGFFPMCLPFLRKMWNVNHHKNWKYHDKPFLSISKQPHLY